MGSLREETTMSTEKYPVAIIGGGPVGIVSSIMLSLRGIDHVVFERFPGTSIHPKACGLNQRSVEIFRKIGVEEEFLRQRAPPELVGRTAWYTSLGPNGREIASRFSWGGGDMKAVYEQASQSPYSVLPQIRLEPILQRRALELKPGAIRYKHDVLSVEERDDVVELTVRNLTTEKAFKVAVDYVLGADGGRGLAEQLGVTWLGEHDIVEMVSAHIKAPLSKYHPDPSIFITWFINPDHGGSTKTGYLYHLGPYPRKKETEEWLFCCALNPIDPQRFTPTDMMNRINATLQIPDAEMELLSLSHWQVNARVVKNYRTEKGRVFLVGDAAHRIPPWGALGLNSGLQDVDNLVWKLALAVKDPGGKGYDRLLNTYSEERRPIGQRVAKTSLHNMRAHSDVMDKALGLAPDASLQANRAAMVQFFDATDAEGGQKRRENVEKALTTLDAEFYAQGAEVGWFYESADLDGEGVATRHDGQLLEDGSLDMRVYHSSSIPGHSLPHAWLVAADGRRLSTRDLVRRDKFVLLAPASEEWRRCVHPLIDIEVIDEKKGWRDVDGAWTAQRGVGPSGAVLVRPDGIVAWRAENDDFVRLEGLETRLAVLMQRVLKT